MSTRWEQWRGDTPEQQMRNCARDLDDTTERQNRHDAHHVRSDESRIKWQDHVDGEIEGLKKILTGFIISAAGIIIVAAINVAVLIAQN